MPAVKRDYRRQYRRGQAKIQAEATRRLILASARKLMAVRGYGATTMEAIARDAGVAVQTVYANFGTKRAIVLGLFELGQSEGDLLEIAGRFAAETEPGRMLRLAAAYQRRFYADGGDVIKIIYGAGASDPQIAKLEKPADDETRERCARIVRGWAAAGRLREGMSQREAVDVLFTLVDPVVFQRLVTKSGWTPEQYETWLVMACEALLTRATPHAALAAKR